MLFSHRKIYFSLLNIWKWKVFHERDRFIFLVLFFYIFMARCEKFEETVILNVPVYLPWKLKATSSFFSFSLVATLNGLPLQFLHGDEGILWTFMMSYIVLSSHGWNWANVRANAVSTEVFLHLLYWSLKKIFLFTLKNTKKL